MKIQFLLFLYFVTSQSAKLRKKRDDNFILSGPLSPSNNKGDENDGFILVGNTDDNKNNDKDDEDDFIREGNPDSDKSDTVELPPGVGTFWHLTDVHWDRYYNWKAASKSRVCPSSNGAETLDAGPFGDYRCDAPYSLINATLYEMQRIESNPDFIIWTGDDTLHTNLENEYLDETIVLDTIKNITELIREAFPGIDVYPALGNHDYHPKNQMPVGSSKLLTEIADVWTGEGWLDTAEKVVFEDGGYYTMADRKKKDLQIVVLNTNLWYSSNREINVTYDEDPAGQFAFLQSVLERAVDNDLKVYIIGHIPPGYFELVDYKYWLYPQYNSRYVKLIQQYNHVIFGQFFGHHHTDSFRVFEHNGRSVSTAFLAPGVSPWMTTLPGVQNGANNPGVRLFEYSTDSAELLDYRQYYLNLEKANADNEAKYETEYRATSAYGISDIGTVSMDNLYKKIKELDCRDCEDFEIVEKYVLYNSVSYNEEECDDFCLRKHACAISQLEQKGYEACIFNGASTVVFNHFWALLTLLALLVTNWYC